MNKLAQLLTMLLTFFFYYYFYRFPVMTVGDGSIWVVLIIHPQKKNTNAFLAINQTEF